MTVPFLLSLSLYLPIKILVFFFFQIKLVVSSFHPLTSDWRKADLPQSCLLNLLSSLSLRCSATAHSGFKAQVWRATLAQSHTQIKCICTSVQYYLPMVQSLYHNNKISATHIDKCSWLSTAMWQIVIVNLSQLQPLYFQPLPKLSSSIHKFCFA